jgi:hypothetical protein
MGSYDLFVVIFLPELAWNHDPPDLSLPHSLV